MCPKDNISIKHVAVTRDVKLAKIQSGALIYMAFAC